MDIWNIGAWALGCFFATWLAGAIGMMVVLGRQTTVDSDE